MGEGIIQSGVKPPHSKKRMTLEAGKKLGRYEIRSQLGAGGMGEVYLAQDTKLDRKVTAAEWLRHFEDHMSEAWLGQVPESLMAMHRTPRVVASRKRRASPNSCARP